jgi:hypothetical protein
MTKIVIIVANANKCMMIQQLIVMHVVLSMIQLQCITVVDVVFMAIHNMLIAVHVVFLI